MVAATLVEKDRLARRRSLYARCRWQWYEFSISAYRWPTLAVFAAHDLIQESLRPCCHTLDDDLEQHPPAVDRCPFGVVQGVRNRGIDPDVFVRCFPASL